MSERSTLFGVQLLWLPLFAHHHQRDLSRKEKMVQDVAREQRSHRVALVCWPEIAIAHEYEHTRTHSVGLGSCYFVAFLVRILIVLRFK